MYKVVGTDRQEYGPIPRETVLEWIAQGRANAQTIARFEAGAWKPLGTFDEFREALGLAAPPVSAGAEPPPFSGIGSRAETNVASVLGLAFALVCCCCPYIGPVLGLVFSLVGWSQIRSQPHRYATGVWLPMLGLGISLALLILHLLGSFADAQLGRALGLPR
jgi:hypothetical protein